MILTMVLIMLPVMIWTMVVGTRTMLMLNAMVMTTTATTVVMAIVTMVVWVTMTTIALAMMAVLTIAMIKTIHYADDSEDNTVYYHTDQMYVHKDTSYIQDSDDEPYQQQWLRLNPIITMILGETATCADSNDHDLPVQ